MSDADLIKLYSQRILALAADMPGTEPLAAPDATFRKRAPLCGSTVEVAITQRDGVVTGYSNRFWYSSRCLFSSACFSAIFSLIRSMATDSCPISSA